MNESRKRNERGEEIVICITGGRYDANRRPLHPPLAQLLAFWRLFWFQLRADVLGHGNAIGTDQNVARWALDRSRGKLELRPCPVDVSIDGPWPAAGHRRNERMLREHKPAALIAFPGGRGTEGCVVKAIELQIPVYLWIPSEHQFVLSFD